MGFGDFLKKLVGGERKGPWADLSDAQLDRVWSARHTLSKRMQMQLRDEYVLRLRPFPFSEGVGLTTPLVAGLGDLLARESLLVYLERLDPSVRPPDTVHPFAGGVAIESGDGPPVLFRLPIWVPGVEHEAPAIAAQVPPANVVRLDDPRDAFEVGQLRIARLAPDVWEVVDDTEELRILIGPAVPLPLLGGELMATDVIGGLRSPATEEDVAQLEAFEWELEDLISLDRVVLLPDVADTCGASALVQAEALGLRTQALGSTIPAVPEIQPGLAALLTDGTAAIESTVGPMVAEWPAAHRHRLVAETLAWLVGSECYDQVDALAAWLLENPPPAPEPVADAGPDGDDAAPAGDEAAPDTATPETDSDGETDDPETEPTEPEPSGYIPPSMLIGFRAVAAALSGDEAGAKALYSEAAAAEPPDAYAIGQLAYLASQAGDHAQAAELAARAAEQGPGQDVLAANHALCVWAAGERDRAYDLVQSTQVATRGWLGPLVDALVHEGDPAEDAFGLFSPLGFRFGPLLTSAARLRGGDLDGGEALLRRCLALAPNRPAALGLLSLHLIASDREPEALELANAALERLPHFQHLRLIRAWLAFRAGDHACCAEDLYFVLGSAEDHTEARVNLVLALRELGDKKGAREQASELYHHGADMALADAVRALAQR